MLDDEVYSLKPIANDLNPGMTPMTFKNPETNGFLVINGVHSIRLGVIWNDQTK